MKPSITVIALAAFFIAPNLAKIETEDEVLVLTKKNIDEAFEQHESMLVEFYAPWCAHCKALVPEYAKAAMKLKESGSEIKLAKVDATIESELAEKYEIRGYPTLKFFHKGSVINYHGTRQADDMINWLLKKTGDSAKDLPTVDDAKSFIDAHNIAIVGFFKDKESDAAKVFLQAGVAIDDHVFGITSNEEVFKEYDVQDGKVVLFKKFDEGKNVFDEELSVENLQKFISTFSLPLVVDFNQDTAQKIFGGNMKSHLLVFLSKEAGDFEKYVDVLKEPAKKFRGEVLFVTINTDIPDHTRIVEFFGMSKDDGPSMVITKLEPNIDKYKPEKPEVTSENVLEFVTAFTEGKLNKYFLKQDLPEDWDKHPVKVLVRDNFHEVAFDENKNVLVEFYAPWCGHCKNLAPIYDELGEKFKDKEDLVIAKLDATLNEFEDIKVTSFPTLILYKKKTNEAIHFNGERTLEELSKFVESDGAYATPEKEVQEEDEDDDAPRKDEL